MCIIDGFYAHTIDLRSLNRANIVMVISDYRPISILNTIPKLIAKILANRLRQWLPTLTSTSQTAFVKDRHIAETFVATREILKHVHTMRKPAVFLKVDFTKAFDSIHWQFLLSVMQSMGFPHKWLGWIEHLLYSSSSRIVLNGSQSEYFTHKRGLH